MQARTGGSAWDDCLADILTSILSFANQGVLTQKKLDRFANAMEAHHNIRIDTDLDSIKLMHQYLMMSMRNNLPNIDLIFKCLHHVFTVERSIAVANIILQSSSSGTASVHLTLQAQQMKPNSAVWHYIRKEVSVEFGLWIDACRKLATNPFASYKSHEDQMSIKATLFPTIMYASKKILTELCNMPAAGRYKGSIHTSHAQDIDSLIQAEIDLMENDRAIREYVRNEHNRIDWNATFGDITNVTDALAIN